MEKYATDYRQEFDVNGLKWAGTLSEMTTANYNDINNELMNTPNELAFFLGLLAQAEDLYEGAKSEVEKSKLNLKRVEAQALLTAKKTQGEDGKYPTDKIAEKQSILDPNVAVAQELNFAAIEREVKAKTQIAQVKAFTKGIEMKHKSLEQLSNNLRKEQTIS